MLRSISARPANCPKAGSAYQLLPALVYQYAATLFAAESTA
ncbi:hypothetical protein SPHS6_00753 [Sphingobium sp. S6]|nr:hypothetical protein SPHS6_00753 [Sphingobium sp. S6]